MKEIAVAYHNNCPDGFGAAWACWKKFGELADYFPMNYDDVKGLQFVSKFVDYETIYIVDFSFPRLAIVGLAALGIEIYIYDHHKTAQADLVDLDQYKNVHVVFDMEKSGAVITWEQLHLGMTIPDLLWYIQDRDLWNWKLMHSREISAYISSFQFNFERFNNLSAVLECHKFEAVGEGQAILRAKNQAIDTICKNASFRPAEDFGQFFNKEEPQSVPVVNTPIYMSEVCEKLLELNPAAPYAEYWFTRHGISQHGLRSRAGSVVDVSVIAKRHGGGGHKNAAGYEVKL